MLQTDALDVDTIEATRTQALLGAKVVLFKSTASTNDIAWQYATNPANHGLCVLAESQSAGRGRRGRTWHSKAGQSVLMSILLLDQTIDAEQLTLATAVAVAEAIGELCHLKTRIKWPNDILIDNKKLAGILVEQKTLSQKRHYVIGIGINCHQDPATFKGYPLKMPATSLAIETGKEVSRNNLASALLASLERWLSVDNSDPVLHRWQQLSALLGQHITVESNNQTYSGFCRGIDPAEGLVVQLDTGMVKIFHANQTTIQAIE